MDMSDKKKQKGSEREKYWNEDYVRYWKARVNEANNGEVDSSRMVTGDVKTTTDNSYIDAISLLNIDRSDDVLEIGCGFGRSLYTLCQAANHVTAVDISEQMINTAKISCQEGNISFHVSPSEELPFQSETFDIVVCFAAFDAMYQTEALIEMNRVSKKGARVLITGKNDNYHDDDDAALAAEVGARKKMHPNYFTDVKKLVKNIDKFGFSISVKNYYPRRGDFSRDLNEHNMPEKFYEYLFVLKKEANCTVSEDFEISGSMSKTAVKQGSQT